jgi:membrane-bound serine protease (ClpP class)
MSERLARAWLLAFLVAAVPSAALAAPVVRVHRLDGMIHGVTASILERALADSAAQRDDLLLLELDTPGGLVDATEDMVRAILNSPVPVAVWVGPRGARAASAGFFLLLAADVAAMAPVTRTGASAVITMGGENKEGDIALKKASEDLAALIRSAARVRGRPPEVAERAVRDARSWSAEEALEAGLIDLVAENREQLLSRLDGREIRRSNGVSVVLALRDATVVEHRLRWLEDVKNVVLQPALLALLLSLAVLGIYIEMTHPGLVLPGVVGGLALLVFLYGSRVLPVRYFAAALVALGVVMFVLEIKVVSYGLLSIGGAAAIAGGLYLLFPADIPGLQVPLAALLPITLFLLLLVGGVTWLVARTARRRPTTGREGLVGEEGETATVLDPEGTVFVHGEVWRAHATGTIPARARVRVTGSSGLLLYVERCEPAPGRIAGGPA